MSLAGDGLTDELYYLLWCKRDGRRGPAGVFLADTIIYKCGAPAAWYFTSSTSGTLLRKNKCNLTSACIEEEFTKGNPGAGDVVAAYLHLPNVFMEEEASPSKSAAADQHRDDDEEEGGGGSCIEYLNRQGLHELLFRRRKDCGILQRFVEPKGARNAVVRAIWSPKVCVVERRTNRHAMHDSRFGLLERTVTYEGPNHLSEATPLRGSLLVGKVERLCWELTEHIAAVTGQRQRIARCVLNFKVDPNDRIYLLWPSSIRLAEAGGPPSDGPGSSGSSGAPKRSDPLNVRPQLHVPRGLRLADVPSHSLHHQPRPTPMVPCPGCGASAPPDCLYPVPYRTVAARHDAQQQQQQQQQQPPDAEGFAPPLLKRLHPTLTCTPEAYRRLRSDPLFTGQSARVCEDCFLQHADFAMTTSSSSSSSSSSSFPRRVAKGAAAGAQGEGRLGKS